MNPVYLVWILDRTKKTKASDYKPLSSFRIVNIDDSLAFQLRFVDLSEIFQLLYCTLAHKAVYLNVTFLSKPIASILRLTTKMGKHENV